MQMRKSPVVRAVRYHVRRDFEQRLATQGRLSTAVGREFNARASIDINVAGNRVEWAQQQRRARRPHGNGVRAKT